MNDRTLLHGMVWCGVCVCVGGCGCGCVKLR